MLQHICGKKDKIIPYCGKILLFRRVAPGYVSNSVMGWGFVSKSGRMEA